MTIASDLYAQHRHDHDGFIRHLIEAMTLRQKLGQLCLYSVEQDFSADLFNPVYLPVPRDERLASIGRGEIGGFFNAVGVKDLLPLQRRAVNESRLGIPLIFAADVIHGFRTIFPVPLAEMASWDPDIARRTASAAAAEASSAGVDWTFAPGVDVARDARWGRMVESNGEDVTLACRFASARVLGYQRGDLSRADAVMATAKHFVGYGAAEAGMDYNRADMSWQTLLEHYLPPFKAAIEAGVGSVMTAFHDIDGVPCTANDRLLRGVLRDQLGFEGVIVSDYTSDYELVAHGLAEDSRHAALLSLRAGLDVSLESGIFLEHGEALVESGEVPIEVIDAAVTRMLRAKLALGLFDDPFRRLRPDREEADKPAHLPLAREAAARSPVLLKNISALPLAPGCKVALIGPLTDDQSHLNGCWSIFGSSADPVTLKTAMISELGAERVLHAPGCALTEPIPGGIDAACAAARAADVVILAIGESERWSGEARSRAETNLPEAQLELARAVSACGKPVVGIVTTGRPVPLAEFEPLFDAMLIGWFLGTQSGPALCDLLTGAAQPRARLPVSFPRHAAQTPLYYNRPATGRPWKYDGEPFRTAYEDLRPTPLYPFGFGLTYTSFVVGETRVDSESFTPDRQLTVRATVANTGERAGDALLQLYVRDLVGSVVRPVRELKDFEWVALEPGERKTVSFSLAAEQLRFPDRDGNMILEPGKFELWISDHAESGVSTIATLLASDKSPTGAPQLIAGEMEC
ncbi:glycoside hydrolase family 3 N-terminal domain-containing protein [Sphingopyxis sp.]|uniref:glycoside hydrolase family 3 N-terminal domain-containing protein n=1 Tax=Sphingopyxis sp. TaxID=1908224 RepID=UPI002DEA7FB5|nr:glycoside hydrolase family 3 N-terminal domain-containing protein [Sphingopyxis sp.]